MFAGKYAFGAVGFWIFLPMLVFFHWRMVARKTRGKISGSNIESVRTEMDKIGTEIGQFRPAL